MVGAKVDGNVSFAAGELVLKHTISIRSGAIRAGVLAGALGLGLVTSGPAAAQFVYWGYRAAPAYPVVPPGDAAAAVRSMGWRPVGAPMRHGPAYVMSAIDPSGQELRVVVDARSGRVVRSAPVYAPRYAAMPPNYVRPPGRIPHAGPDIDDDDPRIAAVPPGAGPPPPGAGVDGPPPPPGATRAPAARPSGSGAQPSAQPARLPLPRPRPTVASTDTSSIKPAASASKPAPAPAPQAAAPAPTAAPSAPTTTSETQPTAAASAAPPVETEFHE
jgi:hypothetical protein